MTMSWRLPQVILVLSIIVLPAVVMSETTEPLTGSVCHRIENYTLTVSESYQEPVQVQTSFWCFAMPPRCSRSQIEWRTRYRTKDEVKQRNLTECCDGYALQKLTINGSLVNKCVAILDCPPGFIGRDCATECPEGSWGISCRHICKCGVDRSCNRIDGRCHCLDGWMGAGCNEPCQMGKYGSNCSLDCQCGPDNQSCHHVTGSCLESPSTTAEGSNWSTSVYDASTTALSSADHESSSSPVQWGHSTHNASSNDMTPTSTTGTTITTKHPKANPLAIEVTTLRPIVAILHVGKETTIRETMTSDSNQGKQYDDKFDSLDLAIALVIASIVCLGLITLAVVAILHVRTKLFETIRLATYDGEKLDFRSTSQLRERGSAGILTINRTSALIPYDYEIPRCMMPPVSKTLPRMSETIARESINSNQYSNMQLFNSLRELMEAHYDRPPNVTSVHEAEHLYDEIPLQSMHL